MVDRTHLHSVNNLQVGSCFSFKMCDRYFSIWLGDVISISILAIFSDLIYCYIQVNPVLSNWVFQFAPFVYELDRGPSCQFVSGKPALNPTKIIRFTIILSRRAMSYQVVWNSCNSPYTMMRLFFSSLQTPAEHNYSN